MLIIWLPFYGKAGLEGYFSITRQANRPSRTKPYWATMNAWRKCKNNSNIFQNLPETSPIHRHIRLPTFETLRPCAGNNGGEIRTLTCRQRGLGPTWPFWTTMTFRNLNFRSACPFWNCCAFTESITYHAHAYNLALFLWQSRTWRLFFNNQTGK